MAVNPLLSTGRAQDDLAASGAPPTTELGTATTSGLAPVAGGLLAASSWQVLAAEAEQTPELRWRPFGQGAVRVYDKMRADPQVQGLLWGLTLPIRRYRWFVDPNGADEQVARELAQDLALPLRDEPNSIVGRTKRRFNHDEHLRHALLALTFGHIFFEQVGEIVGSGAAARWRLRKLAPRMPQSIQRIVIDEKGSLAEIWQRGNPAPVKLSIERLVAYVWEREASNWTGRSLLRAMYGPWLIKQRLVRVDAIKHERNGMGIPLSRQTIPETNPGALAEAQKLAESIRAGEVAGATLPYGFDLDLKAPTGTLPDTLASIRYCDEVMARSVLMMFMMLGQTQTGSRALGSEFIDYISLNQETIADWYALTTSAHVCEDWVDWNEGPDAPAPIIGYDRDDHPELAVGDLIATIDSGLVVVSDEDERAFRERYDLPEKGSARASAPPALPAAPAAAASRRKARPSVSASAAPSPAERAQTDFEALQATYEQAHGELTATWRGVQTAQIADLVTQVAAATTVAQLAVVTPQVLGAAAIAAILAPVLEHGAQSALDEAAAQGATLAMPDLTDMHAQLAAAAGGVAQLLSTALGQSAASKAVALWGGGLDSVAIGEQVHAHLEGLTGAVADYEFAGLVSRAQNEGRFAAMAGAPGGTEFYSSELNDTNTCEPCEHEDDHHFSSLTAARLDYPAGGYVGCLGGNRCRGTIVAVYAEDS